jgi:hypothetical protein
MGVSDESELVWVSVQVSRYEKILLEAASKESVRNQTDLIREFLRSLESELKPETIEECIASFERREKDKSGRRLNYRSERARKKPHHKM